MTDFNTLVADVITVTNHPELIAETQLAVKSATLQLHRREFFAKDLLETAIQYTTSGYLQSIDFRTLFPRLRALKYLRKFDGTSEGVGAFFKIITPEEILDGYGIQKSDVAYIAGDILQIKSSTSDTYALIGYYQNPVVADQSTYNSWIADIAPYAVVYKAAANIFGTVLGDSVRKQGNDELANIEMIEIVNSNIVATGE